MLEKCNICPHKCNVDRNKNQYGRCKLGVKPKLALVSLHTFEEPCISGENGSGTIFFSSCNLSCVYCQNFEISQGDRKGKEVSIERLAEIFIEQQNRNAHNINLVTPTMYAEQIIEAIKIAKRNGLVIPIIYNSNGYETLETLKKLDGYIDVYLPDFKYAENTLGEKYSRVKEYADIAKLSIKEMYRQVGKPVLDKNGIIKKGLIIRHLILPNNVENTKDVLKWFVENIDKNVYISVMAQYFPTYKSLEMEDINRKVSEEEFKEILDYIEELDIENGYIQELESKEERYVPIFNFNNI